MLFKDKELVGPFAWWLNYFTIFLGSRIIGGEVARSGQFPFAAAIYTTTVDGTYFCGGTLLNTQWILTAGQCVDG